MRALAVLIALACAAPAFAAEPAKPAPKAAAKPATKPPTPVTATAKPAVVEAPKPAAPKPAAPAAVAASKPAAANVGFAVQLGAFSNAAEANAMRDKLRAGGFSAFVEQVKTDKGVLNRVRVGPVASRADADKLKSQVSAKAGIDGMVRPHP